jgi:SAM-dependent methyltransferase
MSTAGQNADVRGAYEAAARLWTEGPERLYASLARALLASAAESLAVGPADEGSADERLADGGKADQQPADRGKADQQPADRGKADQQPADRGKADQQPADGGPRRGGLAGGWLAGLRVLDLGAGTGVAGRAALAAGARSVVSADSALGMLRRCGAGLHPVAADATALPFGDGSFDLVLAAFCLGHLDRPAAGLREARRVAAALAASSFAPGWSHRAKAAVDDVLGSFGYRPPPWYVTFKRDTEPWASDPAALRRDTAAAGFAEVRLQTVTVEAGMSSPAQLASWRLGMAHVAPFVASLPAARQAELRRAAESAVAGSGPLVVSMLVLTAR